MDETIAVVGMGSSLVDRGLGSVIDQHKTVVRTTVREGYNDRYSIDDYGERADYVLTTPRQLAALWEGVKFDFGECWLFFPRKMKDTTSELYIREMEQKNESHLEQFDQHFAGTAHFVDITPAIKPALDWYKDHHDTVKTVEWPTKGTAMILATLRMLRPKRVQLAGFDWLADPELSVEKQERLTAKGHDIPCERKLLEYIAGRRGIEIIWSLEDLGVAKP